MPLGLLTGLGAALCWGTLDILSALAGRRIGSLRVTAGIQFVGASLVVALAVATGTGLSRDPIVLVGSGLVGLAGAGAYLAYFTALRIGPIAIVSGVVAAYGGLIVVLAVAIRGETMTPIQAIGATLATAGVILTGVAFDGSIRGTRLASPGVAFGLGAMVLFAAMSLGSDILIDRAPWLEVLLVSRATNAIVAVIILFGVLRGARPWAAPLLGGAGTDDGAVDGAAMPAGRTVLLIVAAGCLDIVGLVAFMFGLERAETWLVGLVSSFGPVLTIIVAVAFLGERLRPIQWIGLLVVLAGIVLIGLP